MSENLIIFALLDIINHLKSHTMLGADYLNFDQAMKKGMSLIRTGENPTAGLMIVVGINVGLRIGDLLSLTYGDLRGETIEILEQKTRNKKGVKPRVIKVNDNIRMAMQHFTGAEHKDSFHAFRSQKGTVYSNKHVNRLLQKYFSGGSISSHSLRKTFGRRVWDNDGQSERALTYLNELFGHSTIKETKKYLGIRQEEIDDIYMNL